MQATSDGSALPCHVPSAAGLVPQGFLAGGVCVALAGEGQLVQEDAVKIKQCCV